MPFGRSALSAANSLVAAATTKSGGAAPVCLAFEDEGVTLRGSDFGSTSAERLEASLTTALEGKLSAEAAPTSVVVPDLPPAPFCLKTTHSLVSEPNDEAIVARLRSALDAVVSESEGTPTRVRLEMNFSSQEASADVSAANAHGDMCTFQVSVWRLPGGSGSYAVEVMRGGGDSFLFSDVYRSLSRSLNKSSAPAAPTVPPGASVSDPEVALRLLSGPSTSQAGTDAAGALSAFVASGSFSDAEWLVLARQAGPGLEQRLRQSCEGTLDAFLACACLRAIQGMLTAAGSTSVALKPLSGQVLLVRDAAASSALPSFALVHKEAVSTLAMMK